MSSILDVARGSGTQHLESPHQKKVQIEHSIIKLWIVHVECLAKFELINQLIHETNRYRKVVLPVKVVFLVEHIVNKYVVLPQEAFE